MKTKVKFDAKKEFYRETLLKVGVLIFLLLALVYLVNADQTVKLDFELMEPSVANPDIIYNAAMDKLDALVFPILAAYPASASPIVNNATEGDLFIIPAAAEGDWSGHENSLALYENAAWTIIDPATGFFVYEPISSPASYYTQARMVRLSNGSWYSMNRKYFQNLYLGISGYSAYADISMNYDSSQTFSTFGAIYIKEATTGTVLLHIDPTSKRMTSDWPIRTASEFIVGSDRGFTGIIEAASRVVVSGGIITGVTD